MLRAHGMAIALGCVALLGGGCTPTYPKCDKDEHCKKGEFCVNGMCQQCRDGKDCPKGQRCKAGRCEKDKECETADDCANGGACKDNKCVACQQDSDCPAGAKCKNGKCLRPGSCTTDADCPQNHECQNGRCVAPPKPSDGQASCTPETIYFDFDEFVLTSEATARLQAAADCIKKVAGRTIRLEGHCDPRGTDEYNLALGDRRAASVKQYLERLGAEGKRMRVVSKGKLEATGTATDAWAKDRKVRFVWE